MLLIGDIHFEIQRYKQIIKDCNDSIVLGDFGIGFPNKTINPAYFFNGNKSFYIDSTTDFVAPEGNMFFPGNHDDRVKCLENPRCLGLFGVYKQFFFISGAWSIDKEFRKEERDWWPYEELSMKECEEVLSLYEKTKPDIVISHDCPVSISQMIHLDSITTRTGQLLDRMFQEHQPQQWIFAHHHLSWNKKVGKTDFRCLNCFETVRI